ncbi:hypothetical protein DITRI_Ditri08aG0040900 [Diplodiscus trichospermus]
MAASSTMRSLLASPVTGLANRSKVIKLFSVKYVPRLHRNANLQVRCLAAEEPKEQLPPTPVSSSIPEPKPTPSPAAPRVTLAMALAKGQNMFTQISDGGMITLFLGTSIVLSLAYLTPLCRGVTAESRSDGFMTSDAELWNSRFAMLGLIALAFTEYVKGGTPSVQAII